MQTKIRRKVIKIGLLLLAIAALIAGIAVPVFADDTPAATPTPDHPAWHLIQGKVQTADTDAGSFTVLTAKQETVTITTDSSTKYWVIPMGKAQAYIDKTINQGNKQAREDNKPLPPKANDLRKAHVPLNWRDNLGWLATFDTSATFADIQSGDRVIVRADGNNLAAQIMIIKAPAVQQIRGTITTVSENSITVTPTGGEAVSLTCDAGSRITLKGLMSLQTGQYAVAVYNRNTGIIQVMNVQAEAPAPKSAVHTPKYSPTDTETPEA